MLALIFAIVAVICDALSWLIPNFGIYFGVAIIVFSILALMVSKKALRENPVNTAAKVGKILGIIFLIFGIIALVLAVLTLLGIPTVIHLVN